jgi:hypothetical protein
MPIGISIFTIESVTSTITPQWMRPIEGQCYRKLSTNAWKSHVDNDENDNERSTLLTRIIDLIRGIQLISQCVIGADRRVIGETRCASWPMKKLSMWMWSIGSVRVRTNERLVVTHRLCPMRIIERVRRISNGIFQCKRTANGKSLAGRNVLADRRRSFQREFSLISCAVECARRRCRTRFICRRMNRIFHRAVHSKRHHRPKTRKTL